LKSSKKEKNGVRPEDAPDLQNLGPARKLANLRRGITERLGRRTWIPQSVKVRRSGGEVFFQVGLIPVRIGMANIKGPKNKSQRNIKKARLRRGG